MRTTLTRVLPLGLLALAAPAPAQGQALIFDGINDIASVLDSNDDFDFNTDLTLEAWVQVNVAQAGGGIIGGTTAGGGGAYWLGGGLGTPTDALLVISTPSTDNVAAPGAMTPGPWVHFAGTFDGTTMSIYVNGVLVNTKVHPSPGPTSDVASLVMGRFPTATATLFFNGAIDEVRLWNVVRTTGQIGATWNQPLLGTEPGLVGYYKFEEPGGDVILDSSSAGNDGFLGAAPGAGSDDPTRGPSGVPFGSGGNLGTPFCNATANSTGSPAVLAAGGSATATDNMVTLFVSDLPTNEFGYFLNSLSQSFVPNPGGSQGNLCLGGAIGRYNAPNLILNSGAQGSFNLMLNLQNTPTPSGPTAIVAGQTWNFQCWYRDLNPAPTSNFTNGLQIAFQ